MRIIAVSIDGDADDARVNLIVQDAAGNDVQYRYVGRAGSRITSSDSGFLHLEITVSPPPKRESSERNVPQGRFTG